jgi:hypothetical protein
VTQLPVAAAFRQVVRDHKEAHQWRNVVDVSDAGLGPADKPGISAVV